jgi:hypothetical protein
MGLYEAMTTLPPGKHLQYQGADGTAVVIEVDVTASGAVYAVMRTQTLDATRHPRSRSRGYAISGRADCRLLEQAVRDLGLDPDQYRVI